MRIHLRPRYQLFKSFYLIYPKLFVELYRGGSRTAGTSKVELFVTIFNSWKPLNIITTSSTLDVAVVLYPPLIWIKTWLVVKHLTNGCYRSSHSEVFRGKGVLTICSKFTGEHPCRSVIYWNHTLEWVFSCKFAAYFQNIFFLGTPLGGCFWC